MFPPVNRSRSKIFPVKTLIAYCVTSQVSVYWPKNPIHYGICEKCLLINLIWKTACRAKHSTKAAGAMYVINVVQASACRGTHERYIPYLYADNKKRHNSRLFSDGQCIVLVWYSKEFSNHFCSNKTMWKPISQKTNESSHTLRAF